MEPQKHLEDFGEQAPTINKMQSEGLSGFLSLYKVLLRSHISRSLEKWELFLSLQIRVIVAPTDSKQVRFLLVLLLLFLIYDEMLLGPRCNSKSGAEYEAEPAPKS